ncbi:hypothetical protein [Sphingomonas sp. GM_Shp_1]|uniref:hypothetical protein n=1 Tax=Sphingomonas sp. GM_Shp_1 TaxID=2937381 RepID=UPI00226BA3A2|nr:hypothetical protein [Sphingomonas sp. GM_Shp_1]
MSVDLITRLLEAGTPAHLVAEVAALSAAAALADQRIAEAMTADMRSPAARKQQRYRDRLKAAAQGNGVTATVTDGNDVTVDDGAGVTVRNGVTQAVTTGNADPAPNKKSPQTPKKINPTPCVSEARTYARPIPFEVAIALLVAGCEHLAARRPVRKPMRIPDDWQPRQPYPASVAELVAQWPPGREQRELDGFRDFWLSRGRDATKTDWDRTWWNRIRDQHDKILSEARRNDHRTRQDPRRNDRNGGFRDPLLERYAGGGDPEMG